MHGPHLGREALQLDLELVRILQPGDQITARGPGGSAGKALDGSSAPRQPIFGLSFCAARSRINGCARSAARRFTRIWATWIAESLAEGFRPGLSEALRRLLVSAPAFSR